MKLQEDAKVYTIREVDHIVKMAKIALLDSMMSTAKSVSGGGLTRLIVGVCEIEKASVKAELK